MIVRQVGKLTRGAQCKMLKNRLFSMRFDKF